MYPKDLQKRKEHRKFWPVSQALPSGSFLMSSSIFLCFRVSTTSARLPLRLSGVPRAVLDKDSPLWRPPSSAFKGEVDELCGANEDITLLPSTSWKGRKTRWNISFFSYRREKKKRTERKNNPLFFEFIAICSSVETFKKGMQCFKNTQNKAYP